MDIRNTITHRILGIPYRLHIIDHGGDGPAIIFLHGIASSSTNWEHVVPLLREQYRCVTIDLLGFGSSPKPEWSEYNVEDHIKSIRKTITSLRLHSPYILVGHSMGSLLATRYASLYPRHVQRLVLLSPPVYLSPDRISSKNAQFLTSAYLRAYQFIRTHRRITPQNVLKLARILPLPKAFVMDETTWLPFIRSLERCIEKQTIIDDIEKVTVPIDIYYGIFDQFIVQSNVRLLGRRPNVTIHPLKVDHAVSKRYAKRVAQSLLTEDQIHRESHDE